MIEVLKSGLYTSVQDLGRFGHRNEGVPICGAMDQQAAIRANQLLGNNKNEAVLEITMMGPVLKFTTHSVIVLTGARFGAKLNDAEIAINSPIKVQPNDVLTIGSASGGVRCYLAVKYGILTERVLGSRSWYGGITSSTVVRQGIVLPITPYEGRLARKEISEERELTTDKKIEVFKGPEFEHLAPAMQQMLLSSSFTISPQSNRMGYLLDAETSLTAPEILTAPVQPGTVQLTPSGRLLVLMRDAQVTGGYARVLQLKASAIDALSQKRGGVTVAFKAIDLPVRSVT